MGPRTEPSVPGQYGSGAEAYSFCRAWAGYKARGSRPPRGLRRMAAFAVGLSLPDDAAAQIADRARRGDVIPLQDVQHHLGPREEPVFLPHTANLAAAMEVLGTGHHRVVITKEGTTEAVSVLSQLRLVRFFWDNHENFSATQNSAGLKPSKALLGIPVIFSISVARLLLEPIGCHSRLKKCISEGARSS